MQAALSSWVCLRLQPLGPHLHGLPGTHVLSQTRLQPPAGRLHAMLQADRPLSASLALRPQPCMPATLQACMHRLTGPCMVTLQTIRVRADGQVLDCLMVQLEESIGSDNARIAAMQHLAPIPTFLFTSRGKLVIANQKALTKCSALSERSSHFSTMQPGSQTPRDGSLCPPLLQTRTTG